MNILYTVPLVLSVFLFSLFSGEAQAYERQELEKLRNDKEVVSAFIKKNDKEKILKKYSNTEFNSNLEKIFYDVVYNYVNGDGQCELNFIRRLDAALVAAKVESSKNLRKEYLQVLRVNNAIDDILYEILIGNNNDLEVLNELEKKYGDRTKQKHLITFKREELVKENDVKKLFANFSTWPDDKSACTYLEYKTLKANITKVKEKSDNDHFHFLAKLAYKEKVISYATLQKLDYLNTKGSVTHRDNSLSAYFEIIFKAKNSMIPKNAPQMPVNLDQLDKFSTEKVRRFSNLTRRRVLYRKYSETQIIMLAQVLQRSSRRMGVDPDVVANTPYINQEFTTINETGETITYVERTEIDPQSQFNLARRLMRRDILTLQTMGIFAKTKITYEDVVMAGVETGYITLNDIAFVVQYDDLWNPKITQYDRVSKFVFTTAGYATFFLPPPWNVFATLALGIVHGVLDRRQTNGANNDNAATFIE